MEGEKRTRKAKQTHVVVILFCYIACGSSFYSPSLSVHCDALCT